MLIDIQQSRRVHTFSQDDFDAFARLSGDHNAIHLNGEFAAAHTPFRGPVAHGMLLYTVFEGMLTHLAPNARLAVSTLMFPAPTYADEAIEFSLALSVAEGNQARRARFQAMRRADGIITCEGDARLVEGHR
ncbi:MAG: MaoC/PaaZ C-terminal domain-containing protein [Pseudomonadota bacterium]